MNTDNAEQQLRLWLQIEGREALRALDERVKKIRHAAANGVMIAEDGSNPQRFFTNSSGTHPWGPWIDTGHFIKCHVKAIELEFRALTDRGWQEARKVSTQFPGAVDFAHAELAALLDQMRRRMVVAAKMQRGAEPERPGDARLDETVRARFEDEYQLHRLSAPAAVSGGVREPETPLKSRNRRPTARQSALAAFLRFREGHDYYSRLHGDLLLDAYRGWCAKNGKPAYGRSAFYEQTNKLVRS